MTARATSTKPEHILLLGASGLSGLAFIRQHLELTDDSQKPYLTLYARASGRSKLTGILPTAKTSTSPDKHIRVIQGELDDKESVKAALSEDVSFPKVTVVISVLGTYPSFWHFLTRTKPTPIGDALRNMIVPAMQELNVRRIMVLSTATGFPVPDEDAQKGWGWYFNSWIPYIAVPQGNAEMKAIGEVVLENRGKALQPVTGLDATVFRVPFLTDNEANIKVAAFVFGDRNTTENKILSRRSMCKWLLKELQEKQWVNKAPMLCNCT